MAVFGVFISESAISDSTARTGSLKDRFYCSIFRTNGVDAERRPSIVVVLGRIDEIADFDLSVEMGIVLFRRGDGAGKNFLVTDSDRGAEIFVCK